MNLGYLQAPEPLEMLKEIHLGARVDGPKEQRTVSGFNYGEGATVAKPAPVPNLLRHDYLALFTHMDYCHGRNLLPGARAFKVFGDIDTGTEPVVLLQPLPGP